MQQQHTWLCEFRLEGVVVQKVSSAVQFNNSDHRISGLQEHVRVNMENKARVPQWLQFEHHFLKSNNYRITL